MATQSASNWKTLKTANEEAKWRTSRTSFDEKKGDKLIANLVTFFHTDQENFFILTDKREGPGIFTIMTIHSFPPFPSLKNIINVIKKNEKSSSCCMLESNGLSHSRWWKEVGWPICTCSCTSLISQTVVSPEQAVGHPPADSLIEQGHCLHFYSVRSNQTKK